MYYLEIVKRGDGEPDWYLVHHTKDNDSWVEYDGPVPTLTHPSGYLSLNEDGILEEVVSGVMGLNFKFTKYKEYLSNTDHKFYGDYEPKKDEDMELVKTKRKEARDFIRDYKDTVINAK